MTEHTHIIEKLDRQAILIEDLARRQVGIEEKLSAIAVQKERIVNTQNQINALWRKYDAAFGPDGTIAQIKSKQAACPKEDIKAALSRQWVAIGLIVTLVGLLKLFG